MQEPTLIKTITLNHSIFGMGEKVDVYMSAYMEGRSPALFATCSETQEPYGTFTVNILGEPMGEKEVLIKDYSENEGILRDLVEAGIVEEPHGTLNSGFVQLKRCYLGAGIGA